MDESLASLPIPGRLSLFLLQQILLQADLLQAQAQITASKALMRSFFPGNNGVKDVGRGVLRKCSSPDTWQKSTSAFSSHFKVSICRSSSRLFSGSISVSFGLMPRTDHFIRHSGHYGIP